MLLPPSADEVMNVVTSAITGNDNNGNDSSSSLSSGLAAGVIRRLANADDGSGGGGGGDIAAQLYMCQSVSIVEVVVAAVDKSTVDDGTGEEGGDEAIPVVVPVTKTRSLLSSLLNTNPNFTIGGGDGGG